MMFSAVAIASAIQESIAGDDLPSSCASLLAAKIGEMARHAGTAALCAGGEVSSYWFSGNYLMEAVPEILPQGSC